MPGTKGGQAVSFEDDIKVLRCSLTVAGQEILGEAIPRPKNFATGSG